MEKEKLCGACNKRGCSKKGGGWNYRMIRHLEKDSPGFYFQIHEIYYDKKGKPHMWSAEPMSPGGDTPIELGSDVSLMFAAVTQPALQIMSGAKGKESLVEVDVNMATGENRPKS